MPNRLLLVVALLRLLQRFFSGIIYEPLGGGAMLFKPLDKDAFAHAVLQIVQTSGLGSVVYDPETFSLKAADREIVIHLGNIFAEHLAAKPWRRSRVLEGFTRHLQGVLAAVEPTADYAKTALRPRVRERTYFEVQRLRDEIAGTQRPEILFRELGGGHLALEVVLDQPDSLRSISVDDLNEWGMTFEDAVLIANDNLLTLGLGRFQSPRPGLFVSAWHDVYDASRLHLAEIVSGLAVKGRPVAMVPNRNSLIITGADDAEGLLAMARLTEEALKQPRPMTGYAFRLDNGWVPFLPPAGHPEYISLHRLFVQTLAGITRSRRGCWRHCTRRKAWTLLLPASW